LLLREDTNLEHNLNRFWEVEAEVQPPMRAEQQACEQQFISNTTQQPDGRFVGRLPTEMDPKQLASSRLSAERRMHAIESRLERQPDSRYNITNFWSMKN